MENNTLSSFVVLYKETPDPASQVMAQGVAAEQNEAALSAVVDMLMEQGKAEAIVLGVFSEEDIKSLFLLSQNTRDTIKRQSQA